MRSSHIGGVKYISDGANSYESLCIPLKRQNRLLD